MKKLAKKVVAAVLGYQIRQLTKKNNIKVVAVAGSIGKTSTKLAVAQVLSQNFKVRYQDGNYNDQVTVPLIFFAQSIPSLFNPLAWLMVFWRNQTQIKNYPYEVVVVELGSDGPGQIIDFKKYLKVEIGVVTAITPEHMEFFSSLDKVAEEELSLADFSSLLLVNSDLCDQKYLNKVNDALTYAIHSDANFKMAVGKERLAVLAGDDTIAHAPSAEQSIPEQYSILAASAVAHKLGMTAADIEHGIKNIKPVSGRMQRLAGVNGSVIIDDSYNASPEAVKLALNTLYKEKAHQKIAVLGNMNELGSYSQAAHTQIGEYCDPKQLELVVTIGPDANKFLAPAAEARGCAVKSFDSPYAAGEYLKPLIKDNAIILIKGSQNKVFAEETVKSLLADPADVAKLVRQSKNWLDVKHKAFKT